jgi:hypothetical protein
MRENMNTETTKKNADNIEIKPSLVMDGTAITEISDLDNINYVPEHVEIFREALKLEKFKDLKTKNKEAYKKEASLKLQESTRIMNSFITHTGKYTVHMMYLLGEFQDEVRGAFDSEKDFNFWLKNNGGEDRLRYFQQARQIAAMGDFALKYAAAGKNRVIELYRVWKEEGARKLLEKYPPLDITDDDGGALLKIHIDIILTIYRLQKENVIITWDDGKTIVSKLKRALDIKSAKKLAGKIQAQPVYQKAEYLKKWLRDGCVFEADDQPQTLVSIGTIISQLTDIPEKYNLDDATILNDVNEESVRKAYQAICTLAQKINIDLDEELVDKAA